MKIDVKPINEGMYRVFRIVLGLIVLFVGLSGFMQLPFEPLTDLDPPALEFLNAIRDSGYLYLLIYGSQILIGSMLILNVFVPLMLLLLAPITVNIYLFHVFLNPDGIPEEIAIGYLMLILNIVLGIYNMYYYKPLFRIKKN